MSTKNLRELVEMAEEAWPGRPINAVARKELEAIERAAKVFEMVGLKYPLYNDGISKEQWQGAMLLFAAIAKDAP